MALLPKAKIARATPTLTPFQSMCVTLLIKVLGLLLKDAY